MDLAEVRIGMLPARREHERVGEHTVDGVIRSRPAAPLERAGRHGPVAIDRRSPRVEGEATDRLEVVDGEGSAHAPDNRLTLPCGVSGILCWSARSGWSRAPATRSRR